MIDNAGSEAFERARPMLMRVAYQMLGARADAEDVVQTAFLRWAGADRAGVHQPEAYLRRIVVRLCLDALEAAKRAREDYPGPWLPEPLVDGDLDLDVTLPLLMALERLSPLERAAFLLRDMFDADYDEIAATIGREPAACRQLVARARANVRQAKARFPLDPERAIAIAEAFFAASRSGDARALATLLADDVILYTDGGGKRPAAPAPVEGREAVRAFFLRLAEHFRKHPSALVRTATVGRLPGFITREADGGVQTTALLSAGGRIAAIYVVRNPDKLGHVR